MRILLITFLFFYFSVSSALGQDDPVKLFHSHKFPCDTNGTTLDINMCSGIKFDFADSLLNVVYNKIIKAIEAEQREDKEKLKLEQSKNDTSVKSKEWIEFLKKEIDFNKRYKESIIKSQVEWIKLRDLNVNVVSIKSEGGTGYIAIENLSLIDETLERIKKLNSFYYTGK
ncbi:MAG: lysozyme inhibitor LprI family protein [Bacteroidia bacterium]